MKRVFIAVKVDPDALLLRMIATLKSALTKENIRWVEHVNIHITMAFLGATEDERIKILSGMLKERCSGFAEFDIVLAGAGVFKNYRDPRIIWAGIKSPEKLFTLESKIAEGLKSTGFLMEERHFKPHLTLGRVKTIKDTGNLKTVLERYKDIEFQKVDVKEVILYESILTLTGPIYNPLGSYSLS